MWNPKEYSIKDQLSDMINGYDVVVSDDGTVMKGKGDHVDVYWPSSSSKGHGHAGFDYDEKGNITNSDVYHK